MSSSFKITLATISLLVAVVISGLASFGFFLNLVWGGSCFNFGCYLSLLMMVLGPATLVLYIAFLKTKRDLFFYFIIALFIVIMIILVARPA